VAPSGSIAVFGGSGNTGRELIAAALREGLLVRALYRPGSEPKPPSPGLEIVTGQLTSAESVERTLAGTDGAVLVFGPRLKRGAKADVFCAAATANVIAGMKALGIERLVCQTGAMAGGDTPNWSPFVRRFVRSYRRNFPDVDTDRDAQEAAVKASGLDWTVAKPFRISGARPKGHVRAAPAFHIGMFTSVRRADLAQFLVDEVRAGRWHRQAVYVVT
jgi:uncharacterized protein YbjT (DUF2867 family)